MQQHGIQQGYVQPQGVLWKSLGKHLTCRKALLAGAYCCTLWAHAQGFNKRYDAFGQGFAQGSYGIERAGTGWLVYSASYEPDTLGPDSVVGQYRIVLTSISADGTINLEKRYQLAEHSSFLGWADCCDSVAGGGFVVGGSTQSYPGVDEARLVRLNTQGDSLWSRSYGSTGAFWIGQQVKHTSDGGFVICGITNAASSQDGFVIKTDSNGIEEWRQTYGLPGNVTDAFSAVLELVDGYLLTGRSTPVLDNGDMYAVRVDLNGGEVWTQRWGGVFDDAQVHSHLCLDGSVLLAGGFGYAPDGLSTVPYVAKLDTVAGSLFWEREYGESLFGTLFFAAKECPNTDIIACGVTYAGGYEQGLLLRAASNGDSLWMRTYSYSDPVIDSCRGRFWDVLPTTDGGFIASGFANGPFNAGYPPGYSQDAWVVKVDSMGCIVPGCDGVGIFEQVTNLSRALKLYPNPVSVNSQVTAELTLPTSVQINAPLRLVLTSMQGQLVKELALPPQHDQRVVLDLGGLAAGLYSVHIADGGRWLTGARLVVADP